MSQSNSLDVELIRDAKRLHAIQEEWSQLWKEDALATPFQSPEWLLPWWNCFAAGKLFVIALRSHDRLIAFVPLYIHIHSQSSERQLLLLGAGTSDYLDGLFADEAFIRRDQETLSIICECIRHSSDLWDMGYLTQLRASSPLVGLGDMFSPYSRKYPGESCSVLSTDASQLPSKITHNVNYYLRRARRMGKLDFQAATEESTSSVFESLVRLNRDRWQTQASDSVLADDRVRQHHLEAIPLLFRKGLLRLYTLMLDDTVIAVFYGLTDPNNRSNGRIYYYLSGFDPAYHVLSPGTLLLAFVLEAARKEGKIAMDMLRGGERYKSLWRAQFFPTFSIEFASRPFRSRPIQPARQAITK